MTSSTIAHRDLETTTSCEIVPPQMPTLKMPRDKDDIKFDPTSDVGKHFIAEATPITLAVETNVRTNSKKLKLVGNADEGSGNILFLPFFPKNITSIVIETTDKLPSSVCYFTTENLSGCNFFIDQLPNDNLVCLHANAIQFSPTKDQLKDDAFAINPKAGETMDTQHSTALKHRDYPGARSVYKLRVAEYLSEAKRKAAEKAREGFKDVHFLGGTTVVGFREDKKWQFWFQTYGQFKYRIPGGIFKKDQEIITPLENIEARCFWRQ